MGYNTQEFKKEKQDDYVNKNFLLVSLEEKKAKKIAEVINNDTSRKIIDFLAKKDATESELSKELGIPISTTHYNIKQLQDAGLVVVEEFHYSQKGKEVNHYALANKYIIITPMNQDSKFLDALKKILPIAVITAGVAFVMQLFNTLTTRSDIAFMNAESLVMDQAVEGSAKLMAAAPAAQEAVRPALQTTPVAYFLIGGIAVIIIYFIYEFVKKK
jgi:DNA-binding transcriptional ArsR family regulator